MIYSEKLDTAICSSDPSYIANSKLTKQSFGTLSYGCFHPANLAT